MPCAPLSPPNIPPMPSLAAAPMTPPAETVIAGMPVPPPLVPVIAEVPGMTALALTVVLQSAHNAMPDLVLEPQERRDVIAYILSLRPASQR